MMLIGLPGSGKSTFRENFLKDNKDEYVIVSLDDFVDEYASANNMNYSEAWSKMNMKDASKKMDQMFVDAINAEKNIIIDMTNMSVKSRKGKLSKLSEGYSKKAYVFIVPDNVLDERLKNREIQTGKSIPKFVITNMSRSYVAPSKDEGFDSITYIK